MNRLGVRKSSQANPRVLIVLSQRWPLQRCQPYWRRGGGAVGGAPDLRLERGRNKQGWWAVDELTVDGHDAAVTARIVSVLNIVEPHNCPKRFDTGSRMEKDRMVPRWHGARPISSPSISPSSKLSSSPTRPDDDFTAWSAWPLRVLSESTER